MIAKAEEEAAYLLIGQIKRHGPEEKPRALETDGKGAYRDAMLFGWEKFLTIMDVEGHQYFLFLIKIGNIYKSLKHEVEANFLVSYQK